jgi:hypothetical protein
MLVSLRVDLKMFTEQQGKVVAVADHSFCFGELERATAILEHFDWERCEDK